MRIHITCSYGPGPGVVSAQARRSPLPAAETDWDKVHAAWMCSASARLTMKPSSAQGSHQISGGTRRRDWSQAVVQAFQAVLVAPPMAVERAPLWPVRPLLRAATRRFKLPCTSTPSNSRAPPPSRSSSQIPPIHARHALRPGIPEDQMCLKGTDHCPRHRAPILGCRASQCIVHTPQGILLNTDISRDSYRFV